MKHKLIQHEFQRELKKQKRIKNKYLISATIGLSTVALLATTGHSLEQAHAATYKGEVTSGDKSAPDNDEFPKNLTIQETQAVSEMAPYGSWNGKLGTIDLLGSEMHPVGPSKKWDFTAYCMNYEKDGPKERTDYAKQADLPDIVKRVRRVYLSNQDEIKKMVGGYEDDAYMVQQLAIWSQVDGVGGKNADYSTTVYNGNGTGGNLTTKRIGATRIANTKKAVQWLLKNIGQSTERNGQPDASVTTTGWKVNGSNMENDMEFNLTKNYGFQNLTIKPDFSGLPSDLKDKVKVYYVEPKSKTEHPITDEVDLGQVSKNKFIDLDHVIVRVDKQAWDAEQTKFNIKNFLTFKSTIDNYVAGYRFVAAPSLRIQDMAVVTNGTLNHKVVVPLSKQPTPIIHHDGSGKSTAMDVDTGTQWIPKTGYNNVHLKDTYRLDGGTNGPYKVVNQLIDPRTNEPVQNMSGMNTQTVTMNGSDTHDFDYSNVDFTNARNDHSGEYKYFFRTYVYDKDGNLQQGMSDNLNNVPEDTNEIIQMPSLYRPVIHSWANDDDSDTQWVDAKPNSNISDRISLSQLSGNHTYKVVDTLVDADTQSPVTLNGTQISQTRTFTTPNETSADLERWESDQERNGQNTHFTWNGVDFTGQQGKVFQFKATVYDITDGDRDDDDQVDWSKDAVEDSETTQFIHVPTQNGSSNSFNSSLKTFVQNGQTSPFNSDNNTPLSTNKLIDPSANTTLNDIVHLENLVFRHQYTIHEQLWRKNENGDISQVFDDSGNAITTSTDFTATGPSTDQTLTFPSMSFAKYRRQQLFVTYQLTPKGDDDTILSQETTDQAVNDPNESYKVQDYKSIKVFKRDNYGRLMKNIKFTIYRKDSSGNWQSVKSTTTNDSGYAYFDDLEPDVYQVREDTADKEHEVDDEVQTIDTTAYDQNEYALTFIDKLTPDNPEVKSKAYNNDTHKQVIDAKTSHLKDDLEINNMSGNHSYTVKDTLYDPTTGQPASINGKPVEKTMTVDAGGDSGVKYSKQITMDFDPADFSKLQGKHYAFVASIYSNTDNGTKGQLLYLENSLNEVNQTISVQNPQVTTDAVNSDHQKATNNNAEQETKVLPADQQAKLMDHTYVQNVVPGNQYTVHEQVMVKDGSDVYAATDANGNKVTTTKDFQADNENMNIDVNFPGFDTTKYKGKDLVVYYQLTPKGDDDNILVQHNNKDDWRETVHVQDLKKIKVYKYDTNGKAMANTKFSIYQKNEDGNMEAVASAVTNADGWASFTNLEPGVYYLSEDSTDAEHEIDGTDHRFHEIDANDINQATYYTSIMDNTIEDKPVITSRAHTKGTNNHNLDAGVNTLQDDLQFSNLDSTHSYHVVDTLMDPQTGKPATIDGHAVTAEKTFTADGNHGEKDVHNETMTFDPANFKGLQNHDYYFQAKLYSVNDNKTNGALLSTENSEHDLNQLIHVTQPTVTTKAASVIGQNTTQETQMVNPYSSTQIVDHTYMDNLVRGNDYTIHEQIMEKTDNSVTPLLINGKTVTATQDFTAENESQDKDVLFGKFDTRNLKGKDLVIYYTLTPKDQPENAVVVKNDRNDKDETIHVTNPTLQTKAMIDGDSTSNPSHYSTLADKVHYADVAPNQPMTLDAIASDKSGNAVVVPGTQEGSNKYNYLMGKLDFTPTEDSGDQQVPLQMAKADSDDKINIEKSSVRAKLNQLNATSVGNWGTIPDLTLDGKKYDSINPDIGSKKRSVYSIDTTTLAGKEIVLFEDLYTKPDNDAPTASHADVDDKDQTVRITKPKIYTMALLSDKKVSNPSKTARLYDKVRYEDVAPGHEINFSTLAMDNKTGKPIVINDHDNNYNLMGRLSTTPDKATGVVKVPLQMVQQGQAAAPTSNGDTNAIINTSNVNTIQKQNLSDNSDIKTFQNLVTNFDSHNDTSNQDVINRLKGYVNLMNNFIYNGKAGIPDDLLRVITNINATLANTTVNTSDLSEETDRLMQVLFTEAKTGYFITQGDYERYSQINSATSGADNKGATATNGVIASNAVKSIPYTYVGTDGYYHTTTIDKLDSALSDAGALPLSNSNIGTVTSSADSSAMASSGSAINATSSNVMSGSSQASSAVGSNASKTQPTADELQTESAVLTRVNQNNLPYTDSTADLSNNDVSSAANSNSGKSSFTNDPLSTALGSQYNIDTMKLRGITMTMAEDMTASDDANATAIATDANLANTDQSVRVTSPTIATMQKVNNVKEVNSTVKLATIIDKVQFKDMAPGEKVYMNAVDMDKGTKQPVLLENQYLIGRRSFTPEQFNGTIEVPFEQRDDHPLYKYLVRDLQDDGMPTSDYDNTQSAASTMTANDALHVGSSALAALSSAASKGSNVGDVNNSASYDANDADSSVNTDNATNRENTSKQSMDLSSLARLTNIPSDGKFHWTAYETAEGSDGDSVIAEHKDINSDDQSITINVPNRGTTTNGGGNGGGNTNNNQNSNHNNNNLNNNNTNNNKTGDNVNTTTGGSANNTGNNGGKGGNASTGNVNVTIPGLGSGAAQLPNYLNGNPTSGNTGTTGNTSNPYNINISPGSNNANNTTPNSTPNTAGTGQSPISQTTNGNYAGGGQNPNRTAFQGPQMQFARTGSSDKVNDNHWYDKVYNWFTKLF